MYRPTVSLSKTLRAFLEETAISPASAPALPFQTPVRVSACDAI
jgi:hypothetical protein